jgi:hypothetical protein
MNIVTVIGYTLLQPIFDLSLKLIEQEPSTPPHIEKIENGYSLSIILLLVVSLESFVGRVRYKNNSPNEPNVLKCLATLNMPLGFQEKLTEVFVLRDIIAHGHIWERSISKNGYRIVSGSSILLKGYGDNKFREALNNTTNRSQTLKLHMIPTEIGMSEVSKIFEVIWEALDYFANTKLLERKAFSFNGNPDYVSCSGKRPYGRGLA